MEMEPIKRSSTGLVEALFDAMDKLNKREIDAEHARAISHTVRSIVQVAKLELEYRELAMDGAKLVSLSIEPPKPEKK